MPAFNKKDTITYRRDEKFGHKLLTAEERLKLVKVGCIFATGAAKQRR
jgi:hypothetical protein